MEVTDEERDRIRRAFYGITQRHLPVGAMFPLRVGRDALGSLGEVVGLMISEDPPAEAHLFYRVREECAVCGEVPSAAARQPATLSVSINRDRVVEIGVGVWVHHECLEKCEQTDQQRGIPW